MLDLLDPLILSRWQFGLTTIFHFLFVPLTIGLAVTIAILQTTWYRTGKLEYLRLTRFFGRIFLINFAMGTVTGIVQEFQFGMNWSEYSRFVGDVFGAPLALEGMLAFFLEATFIGLWIFGWDKLPPIIHVGTIWVVAIASTASAYFILAANAFMQNPVGYVLNEAGDRAQLDDLGAVLTNPVVLAAFPHTIFACFMVTAGLILAVSAWHLWRGNEIEMFRPALRLGLWMMVVAGSLTFLAGDRLSITMVATQPMKMAAAEAHYQTACGADASFSLFSLGTPDGSSEIFSIRIPYLLALLSTHSLDGCVEGINDLQAEYTALYGPGDYMPVIWITYWSFRWMIALGVAHVLVAAATLWFTRRGREVPSPWFWRALVWSFPLSMLAMIIGWVFTEMGRQPWVVFSLMPTSSAVSPNLSGLEVLISLIAFTIVYGALIAITASLILRAVKEGPVEVGEVDDETGVVDHKATVY